MTRLPDAFLRQPIAHRGYHDATAGRPENSAGAIGAAVAAGYGVEIDVQPSADGRVMVIHDYDLERLTGVSGQVCKRTSAELSQISLMGSNEHIPTLSDVLALVAGRAPVLIEVKDQDCELGPDVGPLERAVAADIAGYRGDIAVMSFNPHSVRALGRAAPDRARGLTSSALDGDRWTLVPARIRRRLREIPDYDSAGATFISHDARDLTRPRVAELKAAGATVLCWVIRSAAAEAEARKLADNITFEGYAARLHGS